MNDIDPRYIAARCVLLNALFALKPYGKAIIVAGAQAVYLHTGDADLAISPYTKDADLAINPSLLAAEPDLEQAMHQANFVLEQRPEGHDEPGIWVTPVTVDGNTDFIPVDLIVPEGAAAPGGRRGARLGTQGNRAARKLIGLEAALLDHSTMQIAALDPSDHRSIDVEVAGPAALFVAKAHKLHDRIASGRESRLNDKDAVDVFRLMQTTSPTTVAETLAQVRNDAMAGSATSLAITYLYDLFGEPARIGIEMAARGLQLAMDADTVAVICTAYMRSLSEVLDQP